MIVSPRMDDEIIYSWCFNTVESSDSTPSTATIVLVEILESLSSLRSQQYLQRNECPFELLEKKRVLNECLSSKNWAFYSLVHISFLNYTSKFYSIKMSITTLHDWLGTSLLHVQRMLFWMKKSMITMTRISITSCLIFTPLKCLSQDYMIGQGHPYFIHKEI